MDLFHFTESISFLFHNLRSELFHINEVDISLRTFKPQVYSFLAQTVVKWRHGVMDLEDYTFAMGKKICRVFTESELFDTSYYGHTRIRRINMPLFLLMDDGSVLRLCGHRLSEASAQSTEDLQDAPKAFAPLCGRTILSAENAEQMGEFLKIKYLFLQLDGKLGLICSDYFDEFTDVEFVTTL